MGWLKNIGRPAGCCDECGDDPCNCGVSISVTCSSKSASPIICGWSGYDDGSYDPFDPTGWAGHGRKWAKRVVTISADRQQTLTSYDSSGCTGSVVSTEDRYNTESGTYTSTVACGSGCTLTGSVATTSWTSPPSSITPACGTDGDEFLGTYSGVTYPGGVPTITGFGSSGTSVAGTISQTLASQSVEIVGSDAGCTADDIFVELDVNTTASVVLQDEWTVEAAIAAASPTTGTSCCAVTGTFSTTAPESISGISLSASTSVDLSINITGGTPFADITLRLNFSNEVASTSAGLPATSMDVTISLDGAGETSDTVSIPQPDEDRRRCYTGFTVL